MVLAACRITRPGTRLTLDLQNSLTCFSAQNLQALLISYYNIILLALIICVVMGSSEIEASAEQGRGKV